MLAVLRRRVARAPVVLAERAVLWSVSTGHQGLAGAHQPTRGTAPGLRQSGRVGQLKTELIKPRGPWRTIEQLEFAVFEYIDWWNHRRLHGQIGMIPPAEAEATYYRHARAVETAGSQ